MSETPLERAHRHLMAAADALAGVVGSGADPELLSVLTTVRGRRPPAGPGHGGRGGRAGAARGVRRARLQVRRAALSDLLGWEQFEAHRRVSAAEQVAPRTGLDGSVLPARLPATAEVFAAGRTSLRHVEVIARVLGSRPAGRLTPEQWAGAEAQLAGKADQYTPPELHHWGTALVELLDQDGEEPDDRPPAAGERAVPDPAPGRAAGRSRAGSTTRRCSTRSPR